MQTPRVLLRPAGVAGSSGPAAVELARECGLVLDPWQELGLEVGMAERADGSWAATEFAEIASRQNGKNVKVEARELYGATVLDEWIIHTAHLFKTTRESYLRLLSLIESNRDVRDCLIYNVASPASGYEMRFRGGGRVQFIARSRSSGRGLTGDLLVFDEAQDLDDDAQGALLPTISARPGAQSWYLGSAPDQTSTVFHRIRKRGRAGTDERLAFLEFSADPDADLDNREAWAQANPGLGYRITEEAIESERLAMSDEMFARERLSISPDIAKGGGIIDEADWLKCFEEKSGPVGQVAFAFDVSPSRDHGAFAVAGKSGLSTPGRDRTHVEVVDYRPGTDWLVARAKELHGKWGGLLAVAKASPAASLIPDLKAAGVPILEISTEDHAQACGEFYDEVAEHTLCHLGQRELDHAVEGAARKYYGDAWLWARRQSSVDISPLVAATLAKRAFGQVPPAAAAFTDLADFEE